MSHSTSVPCPKCADLGRHSLVYQNDAGTYQCPHPLCLTLFLELPRRDRSIVRSGPRIFSGRLKWRR